MANDIDVLQIRVWFFILESAKSVFLLQNSAKGVMFRLLRSQTSVKS